MKKAEKVLFVDNLTAELTAAKSFVLINFTGLAVKAQQELKRRLKEVGCKMLVVKNTLLKRAGASAKIDPKVLADEILTGQTALIISEADPVACVQTLGKFAKEFSVPQMKIGLIEGSIMESEALSKLAALPGRDVLLGQLLGTLISPAAGLTGTLQGNLQKLLGVIDQAGKK